MFPLRPAKACDAALVPAILFGRVPAGVPNSRAASDALLLSGHPDGGEAVLALSRKQEPGERSSRLLHLAQRGSRECSVAGGVV